jgi:alkanesulfonate monooxygenase SsuD/methylene tetrahydromethanopterin reductase-like flavin-dependent oxidoreductase (luciferase family)
MVAQYADVWNSTDYELDVVAHKLDVLQRHCDTVGRDIADIQKTVGLFIDPFDDVDKYLKSVEGLAGLGVGLINTGPFPGNPDPAGFVKRFGDEVMPRIAQIS